MEVQEYTKKCCNIVLELRVELWSRLMTRIRSLAGELPNLSWNDSAIGGLLVRERVLENQKSIQSYVGRRANYHK